MVKLRDYQIEMITAVQQDWRDIDRTLVVAATGTGKTITFLGLLDQVQPERALIIAHRRELIYQPIEKATEFYPLLAGQMGVVMAGQDDCAARIVVATIQTLNSGARLERVLSHGAFSHIIVDECHHATAETYKSVLSNFPQAKVAGFTATPLRTDGDGLVRIFQRVSYRLPISASIKRGALVPFDALGVTLPVSLAGIRETEDGWERESLGNILKAQNVMDIVLEQWRKYCLGRQTIAFTANVAQARETCEFFQAQGVAAAWVSGETPERARDELLRDYKAGGTSIVFNCMVLTEGFDAPETSAILMIAPTKSDLVYTQRLGRGLRIADGKSNCIVLDFAPSEDRNVIMAGDVLGKPREIKKAEEQAQRQGVLFSLRVDSLGEAASIDPSRLIVRALDLLRKDALAWTLMDYYATAAIGDKRTLCIALPDPTRLAKAESLKRTGEWKESWQKRYEYLGKCRLFDVNGTVRLVGAYDSFDGAKAAADEIALNTERETLLTDKGKSWRRGAPSDKQLAFIKKLGVASIPEGCTKGQAAQLITHHMAVGKVKGRER
jgi:superfamily II DNA or RNA helicase